MFRTCHGLQISAIWINTTIKKATENAVNAKIQIPINNLKSKTDEK